jgi:hypothetical protein
MAYAEAGPNKTFDLDRAFGTGVMAVAAVMGLEALLGIDIVN